MSGGLFRTKPISAFHEDMKKNDLKRVLTKWGLTSLGIGAIIGGGIAFYFFYGFVADLWR